MRVCANTFRDLLFVATTVAILTFCQGCKRDHGESTDEDHTSPKTTKHLRVGLAGLGDISTLDPARAGTAAPITVVWQIFDRLIDVAPDGKATPMLATSWQSSGDLKEWRFQIRSDAYFHVSPDHREARRVSPADVRASLERAVRVPGLGRTLLADLVVGGEDFVTGNNQHITGITVAGNDIVIVLNKGFAFLPERLAASFFSIVPGDTPDNSSTPPVGSGPLRLVDWQQVSGKIVLERNTVYWGDLPEQCPERITIYTFQQDAAGIEEVRAGVIDWLEATSSAIPLARAIADGRAIRLATPTQTDIRLVALNMRRNLFDADARVARALNYATDRTALVKAIGGGEEIGGPIPLSVTNEVSTHYTLNQSLARELLADVPPESTQLEMIVQPGQESRAIAELLRQQWAAVGVRVTLKQGLADFFDRVVQGDYQLALGYYGPFVPSPEQYLWPYRKVAQPVPNVMGFTDARFEEAFGAYVSTPDADQRRANLATASIVLNERPPAVWLVRTPRVVLTRGDLTCPRAGSIPLFYRIVEP